jgi:hypothetical protein
MQWAGFYLTKLRDGKKFGRSAIIGPTEFQRASVRERAPGAS